MLCVNSSLQEFIGKLGLSSFPSRNTIHEQINALSEQTLELFHQSILSCVEESGLDDFSAVIIDSTAIKADSAWPLGSELLKKPSCKIMGKIERIHDKLSYSQRK